MKNLTTVTPIGEDIRQKFLLKQDLDDGCLTAIVYISHLTKSSVKIELADEPQNFGSNSLTSEDFFKLLHGCFTRGSELCKQEWIFYNFNGHHLKMKRSDTYISSLYNKVYGFDC